MKIEEVLEEQRIRGKIQESIREEVESTQINESEEFLFIELVDKLTKILDASGMGRSSGSDLVNKSMGMIIAAGSAIGSIGVLGLVGITSKLKNVIEDSSELKSIIRSDPRLTDLMFRMATIERKSKNPALVSDPAQFAKDIENFNSQMTRLIQKAKIENIEDRKAIKALETLQKDLKKNLKKAAKKAEKEARSS